MMTLLVGFYVCCDITLTYLPRYVRKSMPYTYLVQ